MTNRKEKDKKLIEASLKPASSLVVHPLKATYDLMISTLTKQQTLALSAMQNGQSVFITGEGGTGKTYVVQCFLLWCEINNMNIGKVAPTGIAALNVDGVTVHRAFSLPIHYMSAIKNRKVIFDVLVCDEISMTRSDIFTHMERCMRGDSEEPFGGTQVILVGDFYQIAPVVKHDEQVIDSQSNSGDMISLRKALQQDFNGVFAFETDAWFDAGIRTIELTENKRQILQDEDNLEFKLALDRIRCGQCRSTDLKKINKGRIRKDPPPESTVITFTNARAELINNERLDSIDSPRKQFDMRFDNERKVKSSDLTVPKCLFLKIGARVMLATNDKNDRWRNGSVGEVVGFDSIYDEDSEKEVDAIQVNINGKEVDVVRATWEINNYVDCHVWEDNGEEVVVPTEDLEGAPRPGCRQEKRMLTEAKYKQFPLKLAWAITAHKSQGQTIDAPLHIAMDGKFRGHGLPYVALSRCTNIHNLTLGKVLKKSDINVDPRVSKFMSGYVPVMIPAYAEEMCMQISDIMQGISTSSAPDSEKEAVIELIADRIEQWKSALKYLR